jgi:hypothetical protein
MKEERGETCSMHKRLRNAYKILVVKPKRERQLGRHVGADGRIILECILNKWGERIWIGFN